MTTEPLKICIGIITTYERHGWVCHELMEFLEFLRVAGAGNVEWGTGLLPGKIAYRVMNPHNFIPAAQARNVLARAFRDHTDAEWLLMIDNDMAPKSDLLNTLKDVPEDASIVVPKFYLWNDTKLDAILCWGLGDDREGMEVGPRFYELAKAGTGAIFIHRRVFETVPEPWFWYPYNKDGGIEGTEDITFCQKAREHGLKIYGNGAVEVGHYHNVNISLIDALAQRKLQEGYEKGKSQVLSTERPSVADVAAV